MKNLIGALARSGAALAIAAAWSVGCGPGETPESAGAVRADASAGGAALKSASGCGPSVRLHQELIVASPTGGDDTAALQCALDAAAERGRYTTVLLEAGRFVAGPLHVKSFHGALRGAGRSATVLTNPETPVYVTPAFQANEPSASNPWAASLVFVGGDFTVSDLTVSVRGARPTTGWTIFGATIYALAGGIIVDSDGRPVKSVFERVAILGEQVSGDPFGIGSNTFNGIYFEALIGFPAPTRPITGSFTVRDSLLRGTGSGTPTWNLADARVRIEGNTFDTTYDATEAGDSTGLDFAFVGNRVTTAASAYTPFELCLGAPSGCGLDDSRFLFAGNRVTAPVGFLFDDRPFGKVACLFLGNQVNYTDEAVLLGPDTHDCVVVGAGKVLDQGTGNHVLSTK